MDLTVLATPFYYASMATERRWLQRHADDPAYDAGQYERRDSTANLTMAHLSVVAPLLNKQLRNHLELGKGRAAKPALLFAGGAAVTATVADAVAKRRRRKGRPTEQVEQVAGAAAVASLATGGLVVTSTWAARMAAPRLWEKRRVDLGTGAVGWAAALVGWDLVYYWNHRFMHESRFMWAIHVPHHSSERYNLSVALRQPVADGLGTFVPYGLLSWLGVRPSMIETSRAINLLYQYWVHTETIPKMGWFERQMNTPSHHRVHHGSNPQYIDRNHGGILISWDKAFGTFEPEQERVVYGLTKNLHTFSPVAIIFREYRDIVRDVFRATSWRDRLSFAAKVVGQAVAGRLAVAEDAVRMEVDLPPFFAMIADKVKGRLKKEGQLMLEKK